MEKDAARPAVEVIRELMDEPGYYWTPHEFVYALADTDPAARTIGPNAFSEPLKESFSKAVVAEGLRQPGLWSSEVEDSAYALGIDWADALISVHTIVHELATDLWMANRKKDRLARVVARLTFVTLVAAQDTLLLSSRGDTQVACGSPGSCTSTP
jgi:hypothetical protein